MPSISFSKAEFDTLFPSEQACIEHLVRIRNLSERCAVCSTFGRWSPQSHGVWRHECGHLRSPRAGTIFNATKVPLRDQFYAMLLLSNSTLCLSESFISRHFGLSPRSSLKMLNRIRLQMALLEPEATLGGDGEPVYVDEVLLKVRGLYGENMAVVVLGMRDRFYLRLVVVGRRSQSEIFKIIDKYIHPSSILVTDKWSGYFALAKRGWKHTMIDHSREWKNSDGYTHTNIDGVFSHVRRFLHKNNERKNIWKLLIHFQFIFNRRENRRQCFFDLISSFPKIDEREKKALELRTDPALELLHE